LLEYSDIFFSLKIEINIYFDYTSDWTSMNRSFTHGPGIDEVLGMTDYTGQTPVDCSGVNPAVDSS
jgi:hypothetical protein